MLLCEIVMGLQSINQQCIESLQAFDDLFTISYLAVEAFHLVVVIHVSFACKSDVSDVVCLFAKDFLDEFI